MPATRRRVWPLLLAVILALILVGAGGGLLAAAHTATRRPVQVRWFYERLLLGWLQRHPQALAGQAPPRWLRPLIDERPRLDPLHPDALEAQDRWLAAQLAVLRRYDRDSLAPAQRDDYDLIELRLALRVDAAAWPLHDYALSTPDRAPLNLPAFLAARYPLRTVADVDPWLERCAALVQVLREAGLAVQRRQAAGLVPPRSGLERVMASLSEPPGPVLRRAFVAQLDDLAEVSGPQRRRWLRQLDALLDGPLQSAWAALLAQHQQWLASANGDHGVWALPDGDAWYAHRVREAAGSLFDADGWHEQGLAEVQRLQQSLAALLDQAGVGPGPLALRLATQAQPSDASDAPAALVLAALQATLTDLLHGCVALGDWQPVPLQPQPHWRGPLLPALDWQPAADGGAGRVGGVLAVDLEQLARQPAVALRPELLGLVLPQLARDHWARQQQPPRLRRWLAFPAWEQGLPLYLQRLGVDAGVLDQPGERIYQQVQELQAMAVLVADTGLHRRHWTRVRAQDYLVQTLGWPAERAAQQADRMLMAPATAVAAGAGLIALTAVQQLAAQRQAQALDRQAFAAWLLVQGPQPPERLLLALAAETSHPGAGRCARSGGGVIGSFDPSTPNLPVLKAPGSR